MPSDEPTRVMIVDDYSIVRIGLKQVLEECNDFEVVGEAADGEEAVSLASEVLPDLVLMDVLMPGKDGVEACREIVSSVPGVKVIMITVVREIGTVLDAISAGATGYVQKDEGLDRLLSTMREAARGGLRVPVHSVSGLLAGVRCVTRARYARDVARLTNRERHILRAFTRGASYGDIGRERGVRPVAVRNCIFGIQEKLGIDSPQRLVFWAERSGLMNGQDTDA